MSKIITLILAAVCATQLGGSASADALLSPGDFIIAIDTDAPVSGSSYPGGEAPPLAVDGDPNNKYLNFAGENSGFIVTPVFGSSQVQSFQLTTANDADGRDPASWELYGTNDPIVSVDNSWGVDEPWTLIDSGAVTLPPNRNTLGPVVPVTNANSYSSYKMLYPGLKTPGDPIMQVAEASFFLSNDGTGADVLNAGDPILAIDADLVFQSRYPENEAPAFAIDGTLAKYLNFGKENSGLIVTPSVGSSVVNFLQITTAHDAPERDPALWEIHGTNDAIASADNSQGDGESWAFIASGSVDLPLDRDTVGPLVSFSNDTAYGSYRMLITGLRDGGAANSMQLAELQLFSVPEPSTLALVLLGLAVGCCRRKK